MNTTHPVTGKRNCLEECNKIRYFCAKHYLMSRQLYATLFALVLIFSGADLLAQVKYSNEFLAIGVGGRAHGMATAQTAIVSDITSTYWNPAGLTSIESPFQVGAMHAEWFAGIAKYDYLAFGKPLNADNNSFFAISMIRLGVDQIPYTLNLIEPDGTINYDNVTEFSTADYAFSGTYARTIKIKDKELSLGGSAKVIRRVIGRFGSAWGFGLDLGAQYKSKNWRFGLMARDISSTFNSWSFTLTENEKQVFAATDNEIPVSSTEITRPSFTLGAGYETQFSDKVSFLAAFDFHMTTDGQRNVLISSSSFNADPRIGIEVGYNDFLYLRAGLGNIQRAKDDFDITKEIITVQPNFGVGLKLGRLTLDYALTDIGNVSQVLYSNIFSLTLDFKQRQ